MYSRQCRLCTKLAYGRRALYCEDCMKLCADCREMPRQRRGSYCIYCARKRDLAYIAKRPARRQFLNKTRRKIDAAIRAGKFPVTACVICQNPDVVRNYLSYDPPEIDWRCRVHNKEWSHAWKKAQQAAQGEPGRQIAVPVAPPDCAGQARPPLQGGVRSGAAPAGEDHRTPQPAE